MELRHIKGIGPAKQKKLQEAGIGSVEELARADVDAVAAKTGMGRDVVREFRERAAALALLQDLRGVGPGTVRALAENGIRSLRELVDASAERIAREARLAQQKAQELQREADALLRRIAADSRTPEGRRKLAAEGRLLADQAATKARETSQKVAQRTQQLKQKGTETVRVIQQEAPERIRLAREKATSVARDVEAKARAALQKAEAQIRTEVEKAKASNAGLLQRAKRGRTADEEE